MTGADAAVHAAGPGDEDREQLQRLLVQLGAAMSATGETAQSVQDRLTRVAAAHGAGEARISAFPTFALVTMGDGRPATVELTPPIAVAPRLDQIAAVDRLVATAERGAIAPTAGLRRLEEIAAMQPRFGPVRTCAGYAVLTVGVSLILHPAPRDMVAAGVLGALVGVLRSLGRRGSALAVLMPVLAATIVAALAGLAARWGITGPGLRAVVASLVVFVPGATLTTSVLELAAGQAVAGASRLASGAMQLAFLGVGIVAGVEAAGVPAADVFANSDAPLGPWAPPLGVLVFAVGVTLANSAPPGSFPGLLVVLASAALGQAAGGALFGGYMSGVVGALVMTLVAAHVSRLPRAMPSHASFLPGFWLLVPGTLGLIGMAELARGPGPGTANLVATVVSTFAVVIGVLVGTLLLEWASAGRGRASARGGPGGRTTGPGGRGASGSSPTPR